MMRNASLSIHQYNRSWCFVKRGLEGDHPAALGTAYLDHGPGCQICTKQEPVALPVAVVVLADI